MVQKLLRVPLAILLFAAPRGYAQGVTLPAETPLPVQIGNHLPMKLGEPIRARLVYPVYDNNQLVLPAGTVVTGSVVALNPDRSRRLHARLRGDFTPFHKPVVQFTSLLLPDGTAVPLSTGTASDGAPIYRLVAPPPRKGGFLHRQFDAAVDAAKDRLKVITGPDKTDRLQQFLYSQLPYHPERIAKSTAWTVETTSSMELPLPADPPPPPPALAAAATPKPEGPPTWILQAYLTSPISSETSKANDAIQATVAEPIRNPDGTLAVPQGAVLTGTVTRARPARFFSRPGVLRFSFRQLTLPGEQARDVQVAMTGADTDSAQKLAMTSEGEVKPQAQDKLVVPLILLALARGPLDRDADGNGFGRDATASNSIGVLGFILGTAAQRPNLAAGLGFYGAAISIYERLFSRGKPVAFARDTRVVLQTTARRSAALKPDR